jgi:5-hydroxyisourate hydrolase
VSPLTTHVLDTARGRPARGVPITLEVREPDGTFREVSRAETNDDGRVAPPGLLPEGALRAAVYRVTFDTGRWFAAEGLQGFYPHVEIVFEVREPSQHHHVPLLVSPYGYSTYRGS